MTPELLAEIKSRIAAHEAEEPRLWTEYKSLEDSILHSVCPHCGLPLPQRAQLDAARDKWSENYTASRSLIALLPPEEKTP